MKRVVLSYRIFLFAILGAWLFLPEAKSFGFPAGSNGWHLNSPFQAKHNADLVCKVQILSVHQKEVIKDNLIPDGPQVFKMIASAKVLSIIKGNCPKVINIEFHYPINRNLDWGIPLGQLYTELSEGEVCLVFLKDVKPYFLLNRIWSKAKVVPEAVDYNLGDTADLRLLAEFLAGCNSQNELVTLQGVEELGYLGDAMIHEISSSPYRDSNEALQRCLKMDSGLSKAHETMDKMRSCQDIVIRSMAIISSFQLDDSPGIEGPLGLLKTNPSDFDPNDSLEKYGIRDFCLSSFQLTLLETMDAATRRAVVDLKDGSTIWREDKTDIFRGLRDFDYAEFYRQALDCEVVKNSEPMRRAITNVIWIRYEKGSVPEMIKLLDDPNAHIRSTGVSALRKCINSDSSNSWERRHFYDPAAAREAMRSGIEKKLEDRLKDYQDNEREYILYWKKWWQEHKDEFKALEKTSLGAD